MRELAPQYDPKEVEDKIYKIWEKSGYLNPDNLPSKNKKPFTITVPPPNITGSLHMGHALNATIQDIIIRKKRMEGFKTLWLPGTDHAGIATQNVVEKELKKEGLTRHDIGKNKLIEKIWQWKEKYGDTILNQFKKLGSSMDWSRVRFTMDKEYQEAVKTAFFHYYEKGLIYRAERVINWCQRCATSLSDLELEYKEADSNLWFIKYPLVKNSEPKIQNTKEEYIIVATTRPETMLGDTAVAVNPKDERYKHLVGRNLLLPIQNREIPIIADEKIEIEFGTGAVKVTPAHDLLDADIGERHKLPILKVIGQNGRMTDGAGKICEGLKISECRKKVVEELQKLNLIDKIEPYKHSIARCYRCNTIIEALPSMQWFLKMDELAKKAMESVKSGKVKFHPKRWEKIYFDWLNNIKDWTISRQIWWGHRIPVFYPNEKQEKIRNPKSEIRNKSEIYVGNSPPKNYTQSDDVLDTWFSSALWPLATLGWPDKTEDLKNFYPTQVLSTARDIINLWVSRMIFSGVELAGKEPFEDIIIHATILTKKGKRMSKSLGTGIDPMDLIEKYGADATRFGLIWQQMGGQDIHWAEEHVIAGKKFCNKLWNSTRFVLMRNGEKEHDNLKPKALTDADKHILAVFEKAKKDANKYIEKYEFGQALHILYDFYWHEFCDIYIENSKKQTENDKIIENTRILLAHILSESLKLMHPFIPYITEQLWEVLPIKKKDLLIVEGWPAK